MNLIRNLFFLFAVTLFACASLLLALYNYNPYQASNLQFAAFYVSFFFSACGLISLAVYYAKIKTMKQKIIFSPFWSSLRQGAFVSLALTLLLFLRGLRILDRWVGGSLLIVIFLLELFFQTKRNTIKLTKEIKKGTK